MSPAAFADTAKKARDVTTDVRFPAGRGLYYGGAWQAPQVHKEMEVFSPSSGKKLTTLLEASAADVPLAVASAKQGFAVWRDTPPQERRKILFEMARVVRANARELAMIDAHDCGNPVANLIHDTEGAAGHLEYFGGLVTEMKGHSVPQGPKALSFSVREPYGVVARIAPYNHPLAFCIAKAAAPLAAGNALITKPPQQSPMSGLFAAELFDGLLPPGVFNVLTGGADVGAALVADPDVAVVGLVGSVPTGRAIMRSAADTLKRVMFELGGKNALIALPDSDPDKVAQAMVTGMNYTWCGQSCGSVSRAFVHADIYDAVIARLPAHVAQYRPGDPTDPATTMGCLVDQKALDRVKMYIASAREEGARLICGGEPPADPALADGCYMLPTIFADVTMDMRIAREEIFGPVQSILKWTDEETMLREVNQVEYGLTCAVWTRDVADAHRIISRVEAGFCWINETSRHARGSPFGGYKQSGIGREECLEELISFTQEKNVYINLEN
ncbi:MAG: aldehyde dehydrogenase [Sphingopyxis macrogoltabida]|uniref:Aldehyde dehydrogenase n=1 Tax=Sphingopyxis macrogoltabida TaxID=33050 RepID=A0A2W5L7W7_SPHMC|nr:MAG: aldehyde dehydrogenase [Sphingopyxis macrogoltabida]